MAFAEEECVPQPVTLIPPERDCARSIARAGQLRRIVCAYGSARIRHDRSCAAGGRHAGESLSPSYVGKRADVVFVSDNLVAEVKSLTSDRRQDPQVATKLGAVMERNVALGSPIVSGSINVRLHDLPKSVAEQALRVVGARVRKEVTSARAQIAATRTALAMPDAYGLVVFVSPPERLGNQTMAWLINDALRHSAKMDDWTGQW